MAVDKERTLKETCLQSLTAITNRTCNYPLANLKVLWKPATHCLRCDTGLEKALNQVKLLFEAFSYEATCKIIKLVYGKYFVKL